MTSFVQNIEKKLSQAKQETRAAKGWFKGKIAQLKGVNSKTFMKNSHKVANPQIGYMYAYFYNPKHKKTLPYYDMFPLTIVIEPTNDGFIGLNLHYLPPKLRLNLLDKLMEIATDNRLNDSTKLKISYSVLKSSTKYKEVQPCIKRYLFSHVRSSFSYVPATEWETVIFLPLEKFKKSSKNKVWSDSKGMI